MQTHLFTGLTAAALATAAPCGWAAASAETNADFIRRVLETPASAESVPAVDPPARQEG